MTDMTPGSPDDTDMTSAEFAEALANSTPVQVATTAAEYWRLMAPLATIVSAPVNAWAQTVPVQSFGGTWAPLVRAPEPAGR